MRIFKITLLVLLSTLTMNVYGQNTSNVSGIKGGTILMGGTMGFTSSSASTKINGTAANSGSQFQFTLAPKMGYFFLRNFCAGLSISFNTASRSTVTPEPGKADSINKESESQLLAGPFFRYYIFPSNRIGIFGELEIGLGASSTSAAAGSSNAGQFSFGIGPGLTFFANDMVAIEALVKYNMLTQSYTTSIKDPSTGTVTNENANTTINSVNFGVGFQFYFNRVIGGAQ